MLQGDALRATHEVFNQTDPLVSYNVFTTDRALCDHSQKIDQHGIVDRAAPQI